MRKMIVAANWKMNLTLAEGKQLVEGILAGLPELSNDKEVVIASPFVHIAQTMGQLKGKSHIYTGAQNCAAEASGAYTGEVSAAMLKDAGVEYVIIGHSERREYYKEDNATITKKVNLALANGLHVLFCCGEALEVRDANTQNAYVEGQIQDSLFHLDTAALKNITIAYEPIWAIGTGRTASSAQAQEMHAHIRSVIAGKFGNEAANDMSILYGGSCKPSNAAELFACADVDGGLIGGAALKTDEFLGIITAMKNAQK